MIFTFNAGYADGLIGGAMPVSRIVRIKSGHTGQTEKPLSETTIQEKRLLGNRISLRRTGLFSGLDDWTGLLRFAVTIFAAVPCSVRGRMISAVCRVRSPHAGHFLTGFQGSLLDL